MSSSLRYFDRFCYFMATGGAYHFGTKFISTIAIRRKFCSLNSTLTFSYISPHIYIKWKRNNRVFGHFVVPSLSQLYAQMLFFKSFYSNVQIPFFINFILVDIFSFSSSTPLNPLKYWPLMLPAPLDHEVDCSPSFYSPSGESEAVSSILESWSGRLVGVPMHNGRNFNGLLIFVGFFVDIIKNNRFCIIDN